MKPLDGRKNLSYHSVCYNQAWFANNSFESVGRAELFRPDGTLRLKDGESNVLL